ncbi:hypothetical protein PIB30_085516, partial [Stylosanthes scabra]|nr:hypothetical protein [Stylosanthes scabra]
MGTVDPVDFLANRIKPVAEALLPRGRPCSSTSLPPSSALFTKVGVAVFIREDELVEPSNPLLSYLEQFDDQCGFQNF